MTNGSEIQQEAVAKRPGAQSTNTKTRIGFWNVRTMLNTCRLAQLIREMNININKLHIFGISECRWIAVDTDQSGETILFSGRNDKLHQQGVTLILKKDVEKSPLHWKRINERLIRARFFEKQARMTVIQC